LLRSSISARGQSTDSGLSQASCRHNRALIWIWDTILYPQFGHGTATKRASNWYSTSPPSSLSLFTTLSPPTFNWNLVFLLHYPLWLFTREQ
jgi:hypothetical protein